jgi:predicted dehydrogenase
MTTVAVIGRGFGTAVHVPAWQLAGADVIGVAGRDGWRDLVARADVVSIATPPAAHAEVALAALEQGKAVFCEKPLAATLEDAEAMATRGGVTGINFSYRALPAFQRFKDFVADSHKLEVVWGTSSRLDAAEPSWKDDPLQGGALSAYGVHALDYAVWMLGPAEVERASIEGAEDAVEVELRHPSARSRIRVSLVARERVHRLEAGDVVLENRDPRDPVRTFVLTRAGERVDVPEPPLRVQPDADGRIEPLAAHAQRFLAALAAGEPFAPSFTDGLQAQRLLDAARRAAR